MAPAQTLYDLYFTGSLGNPRQCIILGEDVEHIFYRFETPPETYMSNTRTTIYRNQDEVVAAFDWNMSKYLGLCNVKHRQPFPMAQLVSPGSNSRGRAFFHNGSKFEWVRRDDQVSYDLYHIAHDVPTQRIATFRRIEQMTPVGPAHGIFQYTFLQPPLLLEALLSLCLNRWMDQNE